MLTCVCVLSPQFVRASPLPLWPCSVSVLFRCASCSSSVARGSCVCRSGSRPCPNVRRRRSSGTWPQWCWHGNRAPVTSCTGKTWRLFTRGGFVQITLSASEAAAFSSPSRNNFILYLAEIFTVSPFPQVCKFVFLLGHREPGEWADRPGGYSSLRGAAGQILWQCIS